MPKKPPTEPETPDQALPDWPLPAEIIETAAAGNVDDLVPLLQQAGLGGRTQAELLVVSIDCWRKYQPLADRLAETTNEHGAARRHLEQLKRYQPESVDACKQLAETLHEVERDEARLAIAQGKAESAVAYCQFMTLLFDEHRKSFLCSRPSPELHAFFRQEHNADPFTDDWRALGKFTQPGPRPIVAAPAAVNRGE